MGGQMENTTMTENEIQLRQASLKLREVLREIEYIKIQYSGMELEILRTPLIEFAKELEKQISTLEQLCMRIIGK